MSVQVQPTSIALVVAGYPFFLHPSFTQFLCADIVRTFEFLHGAQYSLGADKIFDLYFVEYIHIIHRPCS